MEKPLMLLMRVLCNFLHFLANVLQTFDANYLMKSFIFPGQNGKIYFPFSKHESYL